MILAAIAGAGYIGANTLTWGLASIGATSAGITTGSYLAASQGPAIAAGSVMAVA